MTFDTCKGIIYGMILSALLSIPNSYLGAAQNIDANLVAINGQSVNGNNAVLRLRQLSIVNSNGDALVARSTGHGNGAVFEGHDSAPNFGHGIKAIARGQDGNGMYLEAVGDGDGLGAWAQDGAGIFAAAEENGHVHDGMTIIGSGNGNGLALYGGINGGRGLQVIGRGQNAQGALFAPGWGEAEGIQVVGRGHQAAFRTDGGELGGQGMLAQSQSSNANGAEYRGAGTGYGVYADPQQPCQ